MRPWPFDPLPPFGFDCVMADPPWPFELWSAKGESKSPEAQYRTMSFGDIEALPVGDLLAPAGVLFLWCTWPLIERQAACMRKWGLEPKSGGAWNKRTVNGRLRWGTGYVLRSVCEPFLLGMLPGAAWRGRSEVNLIESVFEDLALDGLAREHSRKPEEAYAKVERAIPGGRYAEVFSRTSRPGWACWGDEAGKFG